MRSLVGLDMRMAEEDPGVKGLLACVADEVIACTGFAASVLV